LLCRPVAWLGWWNQMPGLLLLAVGGLFHSLRPLQIIGRQRPHLADHIIR